MAKKSRKIAIKPCVSRSTLFHMKTRVSCRYFVTDCSYQTSRLVQSLEIILPLSKVFQLLPKIVSYNWKKRKEILIPTQKNQSVTTYMYF